VGSYISAALKSRNVKMFVIEDDEEGVAALKQEGIEALEGNAADPEVLQASNLAEARCLLVAIPDAFEGGQVVHQAHAINPNLPIIARAHSEEEIDYLRRHGASVVVMGEHEIAKTMLDSVAEIQTMVELAAEAGAERAADADLEEKPAATSDSA
jgi:CPA2 family monovalent cation:H+ antiporter-2